MKKMLWAFLAVLPLLVSRPLASQEGGSGAALLKALPPDTTLVFEASNLSSLVEKIKASPLYRLKDKPEFSSLMQEAEQNFNRWSKEIQSKTGVEMEKFLAAWKGDVSFVVGDLTPVLTKAVQAIVNMETPDIDPSSIPIMISADAAGGKSQVASDLQKILDTGRKEGVRIEESPFQQGKIVTLHRPQSESSGPEKIFIGESGSRYLLTLDRTFLQQVMSKISSGSAQDSLMSKSTFQTTYQEAGSGGDVFFFANVQPVIKALDQTLGLSPYAFVWAKVKTLLFGQSLNNLGVSLMLEEKGIREKVFIHNGGAEDGVMGWFKGPEIAAQPPSIIPESAMSFSSASIDMSKLFASVREIVQVVQTFSGNTTDIDTQFQQIFGLSLNDFIRNFGNKVDTFLVKGPTENNPMGDLTLVFQLADDGPMTQMLEKISMMSQGQLVSQKYLNRDLYSVPPIMPGLTPSFCVSDQRFIMSMVRDNVELVVRRMGKDDPGLAGTDAYKKAAAGFFPAKVSGLSYTDEKYLSQTMSNIMDSMRTGMPSEVPPELFMILSAVGESFGSQVGYGKWKDNGLYSEMWTPYR